MTEAVLERPLASQMEAPADGCPSDKERSADRPKLGKRNKALGARGEEAAARFLYRRGYEVVERNWTCFVGEADIIALDGDTLVFVEVKTRRDCQQGFPSEAVTSEKRSRYERIALAYLTDHDFIEMPVRFDVVSIVVISEDKAMIRHQINAFSADMR